MQCAYRRGDDTRCPSPAARGHDHCWLHIHLIASEVERLFAEELPGQMGLEETVEDPGVAATLLRTERAISGLPPAVAFNGATYEPEFDYRRLNAQMRAVWECLRDGRWRTLAEIAAYADYPEASVSARLRDFRKRKYGGHNVERRRRDGAPGTWEYRLLVKERTP